MEQNNSFKLLQDILEKLRLVNSKLNKLAEQLNNVDEKQDEQEDAKILPFIKKDT